MPEKFNFSNEHVVENNFRKLQELANFSMRETTWGASSPDYDLEVEGKKYPTTDIDAWLNEKSGEIVGVGYVQNVPEDVRKNNSRVSFSLVMGPKGIDIMSFNHTLNLSHQTNKNVRDAIKKFNEEVQSRKK